MGANVSLGAADRVGALMTHHRYWLLKCIGFYRFSNRTSTFTTKERIYVLTRKGYSAMFYLDFSQFVLEYLHD